MVKAISKIGLLEGLNKEQLAAVQHESGPLLIIAGAGTGKTTVITKKIAWLIEQKKATPAQILALTFTNKTAEEMQERVDRLLPLGVHDVEIATFHSFCERVLKDHALDIGLPSDFKLLDETAQWLLVRKNLDKFDLDYYRPLGNPTKFIHAILKHFSRAKDEEVSPEAYMELAQEKKLNLDSPEFTGSKDDEEIEVKRLLEVAGAYHQYQKLLYENSALDFGDLIMQSLRLFRERPNILKKYQTKFKYVLVDEFQDTNYAQYDLVKLLAKPENNLTVVADDDQSIYKFRGASFSNIIKFMKDYPDARQIMLVENYRSRQNILDLSYKFIQANNPDRLEIQLAKGEKKSLSKKLKSFHQGQGEIAALVFPDKYTEAEGVVGKIEELVGKGGEITYNDFAVLARSHDLLEPVISVLEKKQIPYIYLAKGLYHKPVVRDLISYFKILYDHHDNESLYRTLLLPIFEIDHSFIIEVAHNAKKKNISLFDALKMASAWGDAKNLTGLNKFFALKDRHCRMAAEKNAEEIFIRLLDELEFRKRLTFLMQSDPLRAMQDGKLMDLFYRKVKDFALLNADKSLKSFLSQIAFEEEAGEQGHLDFDTDVGPEAIKIMTAHGSKGLEFEYVFVVGLVDKRFPSIERPDAIELPEELIKDILPEGDIHLQEERRLLYVAMTRARKGLYLTRALDYGGKLTKKPSKFLIEMGLAEEEKAKPTGETSFRYKTPKVSLPVPKTFSFSQISKFIECPLEYKYTYVLGVPTPGSGNLSFGRTLHKTFEKFLSLVKSAGQAQDLFGAKKEVSKLPEYEVLKKIYDENWIDEWYKDKKDMEDYRKLGFLMLKSFYEECKTGVRVKYLEHKFRLKFGPYLFTGEIDRADETPDGLVVIDYKTGKAPEKMGEVNKEQLLIYQMAAQESLGEKVAKLEYWYLRNGLDKHDFLGTEKELAAVKEKYIKTIEQMVRCIKDNDFYNHDLLHAKHQTCKYRDLEKGEQEYLTLAAQSAKKSKTKSVN